MRLVWYHGSVDVVTYNYSNWCRPLVFVTHFSRHFENLHSFIQRFLDACGRDHAACTYTITHTLALLSSISNVAPTCLLYDIAGDQEACIDRILAAMEHSPGWSTEHNYRKRKSVLHFMLGWPITDVAKATTDGWCPKSIPMTHSHRIEEFGRGEFGNLLVERITDEIV